MKSVQMSSIKETPGIALFVKQAERKMDEHEIKKLQLIKAISASDSFIKKQFGTKETFIGFVANEESINNKAYDINNKLETAMSNFVSLIQGLRESL